MIALLRRIGGLPWIEPLTALLLRAWCVRQSARFVVRELRGGRRAATYDVRGLPARVIVRHGGGDAVTIGEVFHQRHYVPPPALAGHVGFRDVLDLGANIGLFGAFASARWPDARIVAYEPDPANAEICAATIAANGSYGRWELRRAAASNEPGDLRFHASGDALSRADAGGELSVPAEDVLPRLGAADLVKMDIEGGEWPILGDERFAAAPPRAIVLEYHPHLCPSGDPRRTAQELLERAGLTAQEPIFHRSDGHGMLWAWRP